MSVLDHAKFLTRLRSLNYEFGVFFDIGASIGRWSREAQRVFPEARFELFEPLAGKVAEVDARSVVAEIPGARLHPVALSDFTGQGEIKLLGNAGVGSSILVLDGDRRKGLTIIPCDCWRLDDLVAELGLLQPSFLKLDTQASELKVLKGGVRTLRGVQFILLETWARRVYGPETPLFNETAAWLAEQGFFLYEILSLDEGRDEDGTLRWFDAVFINAAASRFPRWML